MGGNLTVDGNGIFNSKVGIGTTSPGFALDVNTSDTVGISYSRTGASAKRWGFHLDNSNTYWHNITDSVLALTLSNAGNLGLGTSSPSSSYRATVVTGVGQTGALTTTGSVYINTGALGVNVAASATAGRIDASNDIVAYSTSDQRLKENIKPLADATEKVKKLTGVEFDWKQEHKEVHGYEGHDVGVIAQEVQEVLPEAIRTNDSGYLSVRYEKLIGLLIESNKELAARIEELEAKLK